MTTATPDEKRALILSAAFYPDIADLLERDALVILTPAGFTTTVHRVPGAFELPTALAIALEGSRHDIYIALGAIIRGETSHYDFICRSVTSELQRIASAERLAFGFGVITAEKKSQAYRRADGGGRHRVAARAVEAALVLHRLRVSAAEN
ncbi:MAG: 6,7-dimethyl-8-ribityllumazine synthase [Alphaproteobacteria bacterium]|nr:6,7-dimethyl-8-ribityllumazine synthase [Alphaproteobacteria bacterium]MDA7987967.1 6,7-dimethyl-8-ribityllumazine synthase [Alphaproteobacteria bacterium]MDA7989081.1 6,7-dimethyl-8-ribityllumazine synthase [Alphaproteobacteria bacterium]MDA8001760.1 6,7-dimethyl-8-ribityllumazine synthase [Alphaproteobacteria bacterium]MDA8004632.1 6,7-dimethyl-8-ribityllumazine synthase [Alphaproteobacteria bacterium]